MSEHGAATNASRWLNAQVRSVTVPLACALAAGAVAGLLLIPQAVLLARIIDGAVFHHVALASLRTPLILLAGVFVLRAGSTYAFERAAFRAAGTVKLRVRSGLLDRIHALGPGWLNRQAPGALATTLAEGVEALEAYYARYLPQSMLAIVVPVAILAVIFPIDWISGLILLGTAPLIPVFMVLIGKGAEAINAKQWRRLARLAGHFFEVLAGIATLKAFGASSGEARLVARLSDQYRASTMGVLRVAFLNSLALEFLATVSIAMVAVLVGFRLLWGDISFTAGLTVLLLVPEFYLPLRNFGQSYHARLAAVAAAENIAPFSSLAAERPFGKASFRADNAVELRFEQVNFAYEGNIDVLSGITFEVPRGSHIALVGPSGSGKSTLLRLLLGFATPRSGHILVDGCHLQELNRADWHTALAWVPQRPHLFAGTIADNIRLGCPQATDESVRRAAVRAQANGFIERLPLAYAMPVDQDGGGLSGGELRRIAIARAILRDAALVILDEPTASLDAESEAAVMQALEELTKAHTVISVAHRLRTVKKADRILVLDAGRIVASGAHSELLASCYLYRALLEGGAPT